ncbi:MAG: Gfo/Idh/MocA family oxidoreductase [Desulfobacteraceae bacterium]|nr:Gfo/Idh/MocA family oxidoreductase [Desulfobacteraceae bacterium]
MDDSTIRAAVVGVGYLGKFHAQKYKALSNVKLVGVVDIEQSQAQHIAQECQTQAFSNHRDLIGKVDAISIAVPTKAHYTVAREFLENGVDLLIEKPITSHLHEADDLVKLADKNNCILQVGHLERFNSAVLALNGILNEPRFIESHRLSTFKDRGTDVSVILDLMIHDIDIILNLVKQKVTGIHAAGISVISSHIDIANARLEFANSCVANVTASRISAKNERKIRLFQKDAYISVDFANHKITTVQPDNTSTSKNDIIPGMSIKEHCFTKTDALDDEIKAFIHSVKTRQKPAVTGQMGRDALEIALNITEQIQRNPMKMTGV